jgi:hypothetical protein
MAIGFVRKYAYTRAFGTAGGGDFDCTDCDFVVVFAMHGAIASVSTDTLDGVNGTNIALVSETAENHYTYNSGHYWLTPGSGTKALVITWSGNGTNRTAILGYQGVEQAPIVQHETNHGWSSAVSDIVASTKDGNLVVDGVAIRYGTAYTNRTVGALQTVRSSTAWGADGGEIMESCSDEPADGDITMSWTSSGTPKWAQISIELQAKTGGNRMILMMSEIYKGIQENRKKVGVGDLGNFGLKDGLWKPKERLVTI